MRPRYSAVLAAMMCLPGPATASDNAAAAIPADFLEYLASLEGNDENWTDFESIPAPPLVKPAPAADAAKAKSP